MTNVQLWKQYLLRRKLTVESHACRTQCSWAIDGIPAAAVYQAYFPYLELERNANELLLLRGTTIETAKQISEQGFDERRSRRHLYGKGVYLTTDPCRALQHCDTNGNTMRGRARRRAECRFCWRASVKQAVAYTRADS